MNRTSRRRRPDWPVMVYTYKIRPRWALSTITPDTRDAPTMLASAGLPPEVWAEAHAMRDTWNTCVGLMHANRARYEALMAEAPEVTAARTAEEAARSTLADAQQHLTDLKAQRFLARQDAPRGHTAVVRAAHRAAVEAATQAVAQARLRLKARRADTQAMRHTAKAHLRPQTTALLQSLQRAIYTIIQAAPIYWAHKTALHDTTREALSATLAGRSNEAQRKDGPLRHIFLQHHLMDGGLPVERLFMPTTRFAFAPVTVGQRAPAIFRMGGRIDLPFQLTWHRLPPAGSYIKKIRLIGDQRHPPGWHKGHPVPATWEWHLQLTVEVPPSPPRETVDTRPVAGVDLNWRVTDHGLRIAVAVGTDQVVTPCYLAPAILEAWEYTRARQSNQSAALERVKANLLALDDLPEGWRRAVPMAGRGTLEAWLTRVTTDEALTAVQRQRWGGVLRQWAHLHTEIGREIRGRDQRFRRQRRWEYFQQAHALCQRYGVLVLEDLDLRQLAHPTEETDPAVKAANVYRHLAALSEWRHCLTIVAPKYHTQLVIRPAAGTTSFCALCGAPVAQTGAIVLWCRNGHGLDTDENAGRRLRDGYIRERDGDTTCP